MAVICSWMATGGVFPPCALLTEIRGEIVADTRRCGFRITALLPRTTGT